MLTVAGTQARLERHPPRSDLTHNTYPCQLPLGEHGRGGRVKRLPRIQEIQAARHRASRPPADAVNPRACPHQPAPPLLYYQEPYRLGPIGGTMPAKKPIPEALRKIIQALVSTPSVKKKD